MTNQLTSAESEKAFPSLGCFVAKVRNRLQDETFLCFYAFNLSSRNLGKINMQEKDNVL